MLCICLFQVIIQLNVFELLILQNYFILYIYQYLDLLSMQKFLMKWLSKAWKKKKCRNLTAFEQLKYTIWVNPWTETTGVALLKSKINKTESFSFLFWIKQPHKSTA